MGNKNEKKRQRRMKLVRIAVAADQQVARQYHDLLKKYSIPSVIRRIKNAHPVDFDVELLVREENAETSFRLIQSTTGHDSFFGSLFKQEHSRTKAS